MIVFVPCGGLGNLLFQHAAAWSHAREQGQELAALGWYPDVCTVRPKFAEYSQLFKHVKMLGKEGDYPYEPWPGSPSQLRYLALLSGETNVWEQIAGSPIPNDARILTGYFQSWKYFDKYRIEIRDLLRSNESEAWAEQKARFSGGVCMHVRRGDYLRLQDTHPVCPTSYYTEAMKLFPNNKFLLFCEEPVDDIVGDNIEVINEPDPIRTLFLMSLCDGFIIANSTLSLMAYYMREQEGARLVAPKNWFGPKASEYDINDILKNTDNLY